MQQHGVNFVTLVLRPLHLEEWEPLASAGLVAALLLGIGVVALAQLRSAVQPLVPDRRLSARNFLELVFGALVSLADSVLGRENRKYLPFLCSLFVYLFFMNLLGLVPGFSMPTDNPPINAGLALLVFVLYHYWGMKEVGVVSYWKHFAGPVIALAPLIFALELFSHMVRPFTLTLRLYGNMTADHTLLGVFTDLTKVGIPVIFYAMGTLVSFVQAFVFTVLTMVYIKLAVAHEESHEEGHEAH
jgi:F-type H+-transporting ATPase subunit a